MPYDSEIGGESILPHQGLGGSGYDRKNPTTPLPPEYDPQAATAYSESVNAS
jgi:hypothetical protein